MRSAVMMKTIALVLCLVGAACGQQTPNASQQLESFKNATLNPGVLRLSSGIPVSKFDAENSLQTPLTENMYLIEKLSKFNRERIPQRVVHGKGTGARGYFNVTHDVTSISNLALFSEIGKITQVAARMSAATSDRGSPDAIRSAYSVSAKFYTEEGNWDFLGFNTDIFFIKDTLFFTDTIHSFFKNPVTGLTDPTAAFDFFLAKPEAIPFVLLLFGDPGVPASYRNVPSHTIHTFQVENDRGEIHYVKFKLIPDAGEAYMNLTQQVVTRGAQPEFYTADLYNTIASGKFPTWTLAWQVMSELDAKLAGFNIFDITLRWPQWRYPFQPIGKLTLNKNPDNQFSDVEQISLNPGNLPPGLQGCDPMLAARRFAYRDAAMRRLGVNFNKIKVNCPLTTVLNYDRDGAAPVGSNQGGAPNYYPNSFNGPQPVNQTRTRSQSCRPFIGPEVSNVLQGTEYFLSLPLDAQLRLINNLATFLSQSNPDIHQRAIEAFGAIHPALGTGLSDALNDLLGILG